MVIIVNSKLSKFESYNCQSRQRIPELILQKSSQG